MPTIYQIKEAMAQVGNEMRAVSDWISENAGNPKVEMKDIKAKQERRDELEFRFNTLKKEHDTLEASQKAELESKTPKSGDGKAEAKGKFYRAVLSGSPVPADVRNALGAIPEKDSGLGGGENLLPTTMTNEIITEPFDENPLRPVMGISNISGLEMPKMAYSVDDDDFINDKETAKEMKLDGGKVTFGRFKTKIKAEVSDTVLKGSAVNLSGYIDNALRSGLASKEKKCIFDETPNTEHAHMSFYSASNNIKKKTGSTMLKAILAAYGDLADVFAEKAKVIMRRADYVAMISELANGADTLWGKKPEDVIGIPVIFCDRAKKPVVGDMSYLHMNYDNASTYDSDKDVDKGIYKFVLTAWFDIKLKLKSAFRIAEIGTDETPVPEIDKVEPVNALPTTGQLENTIYVLLTADNGKAAGTMWKWVSGAWVEYTE